MRSAVIGAAYPDDQEARHAMTIALSQVTHTHPDAIAGALIGADLTAHASTSDTGESTHAVALRTLQALDNDASQSILEWATHWRTDNASSPRSLRTRCYLALDLANRADVTADDAVRALGSSGWTNHTVPLALYWFSCVGDPERALTAAVRSGGDTDTVAAIVGAWSVSKFGVEAVPPSLLRDLQDGTYGRQHLTNLADSLDASINGDRDAVAPRISFGRSAGRNVVTLPNLVFYAFRAVFIRR
jgi:ADP-ribosylglycohydrolase